MASMARVTSIDDLEKFRAAYCEFEEDSKASLGSVDMEVRRALSWLKQDRFCHWQAEERRWRQKLSEAKNQLNRKRISTAHGVPKDSYEKELVREAEAKLKQAEDKLQKIKKWIPVLERAVEEYQSYARPLGDMFVNQVPKGLAKLAVSLRALEKYLAVAAPSLPRNFLQNQPAAASSAVSSSPTSIQNPTPSDENNRTHEEGARSDACQANSIDKPETSADHHDLKDETNESG